MTLFCRDKFRKNGTNVRNGIDGSFFCRYASWLVIFLLTCQRISWGESESISFCRQIAPLLEEHCVACHGAKKSEGGYRVDSYDAILAAGDSGETPIAIAESQPSEVLRRVTAEDSSERMPADREALSAEEITLITAWMNRGAQFDGSKPSDPLWLAIPATGLTRAPTNYRHPLPITTLAFASDGEQLVVGGYHELTVWSVKDGSLLRRIPDMAERVFAIAASPDGETLAVAGGSPGRRGDVRLVDSSSGAILQVMARSSDAVFDLAYRPGVSELAVAFADSTIRVFNTESFEELRSISAHADWVTALAWSDDGSKLVSASRDKSSKVFDAVSGNLLASHHEHDAPVTGVAFLPEGNQVVSGGADNMLYRWDATDGHDVAEAELGGEPSKLVRAGHGILVPCSDNSIRIFDVGTNAVSATLQGHHDWVLSAAYHAPTQRIATGSFDGEVFIWDAADHLVVRTMICTP